MSTTLVEPAQAVTPFQFATASYLTRVENFTAHTIAELSEGISQASDASIFYHTFQTLSRHHFLTEGFSNDFAQWVLAGLNQPALAERLASIDVRDYLSIAEMRADLRRIITEFQKDQSGDSRKAFEPFYFCQAVEVTQILPWDAKTLAGFRAGLERLSHASFYYHFIASRLRLQLRTNDFSNWFENALGLRELAEKTNRIDIYTNTLDSARRQMSEMIDREMKR